MYSLRTFFLCLAFSAPAWATVTDDPACADSSKLKEMLRRNRDLHEHFAGIAAFPFLRPVLEDQDRLLAESIEALARTCKEGKNLALPAERPQSGSPCDAVLSIREMHWARADARLEFIKKSLKKSWGYFRRDARNTRASGQLVLKKKPQGYKNYDRVNLEREVHKIYPHSLDVDPERGVLDPTMAFGVIDELFRQSRKYHLKLRYADQAQALRSGREYRVCIGDPNARFRTFITPAPIEDGQIPDSRALPQ